MSEPVVDIYFRLNRVRTERFEYTPAPNDGTGKVTLDFSTTVRYRANNDTKEIQALCTIVGFESESKVQFFTISVSLAFGIQNYEELGIDENFLLPDDLGLTLSSVAFSTVRGILVEKLSGTVIRDFVLPVINPDEFFRASESPEPGDMDDTDSADEIEDDERDEATSK